MNESTDDCKIKNSRVCGEIHQPVLNKHFAVINPSKMCQPMGAIQALLGAPMVQCL